MLLDLSGRKVFRFKIITFDILFFLSCLLHLSCNANKKDESKPTNSFESHYASLSVKLKPKTSLIFNGFVYASKALRFENHSNKDTIIEKRIKIKKPTFLFYLEGKLNNGKFENNVESIILLPKDSIVIDNDDKKIIYSTGINDFIDRIINVPLECYPIPPKSETNYGNNDLRKIEDVFNLNQQIIEQETVDNAHKTALQNLNLIIKDQQISKIPFKNSSSNEFKLRDSLNNEIMANIDKVDAINSSLKQEIFFNIISFNAFLNNRNIDISNAWDILGKVDDKISKQTFYKEYYISNMIGVYNYNPKYLVKINTALNSPEYIHNPIIDTLRPLAKYLQVSLTDLRSAKDSLSSFNNGKYSFILDNEMEVTDTIRFIKDMATTNLININNNITTFKNVLLDPQCKIFVIDVWAHWCAPCINEFKTLQKIKKEFKGEPVKFIGVSIDKDEEIIQWKNSLQYLKGAGDGDQFLLQHAEKSPFRFFFHIETIPRFIIINNEGRILNDNFVTPTNAEFNTLLRSYLNN